MVLLDCLYKSCFCLEHEVNQCFFYDVYYYVMPSIAAIAILVLMKKPESKKKSEWEGFQTVIAWIAFIVAVSFLSYLLFFIDYCLNTPLSYVIFPIIPIPMTYLYFNSKKNDGKKLLSRKIAAFTLIIIVLMPYAVAFSSFNLALSHARATQDDADRVELVSNYVRNVTTSFWGLSRIERKYTILHRAETDFLKFLMVGVRSCGEMAHAVKILFDNLNLESRLVSFPGEDHMFVEVKFNGTWLVVDPGYQLNLVTREERGSKRLEKLGGLSYVVAYTDQGLIELTHYYVTTDRIIIRVTDNDEPIVNARIGLSHTFMGNKMALPDFYSDVNGTVELNLGPLTYNNSDIEPAEPYYWIYINDQKTQLKVSSTGSGKSTYIEVEMADILEARASMHTTR